MVGQLIELPVESVVCRPQVREVFDEELITELAQTAAELGIQQPISVYQDGHEWILIDGEMRLRAAIKAGIAFIAAVVKEKVASEGDLIHKQLVSNQHISLPPLQKAKAIDRLMHCKQWSPSETAAKLGISPSLLAKLLKLLTQPKEVQDKVAQGKLRLSTAYAISQAESAEAQVQLANEAVEQGLTRQAVEERSKARKSHRKKNRKKTTGRNAATEITLGAGISITFLKAMPSISELLHRLSNLIERLQSLRTQGYDSLANIDLNSSPLPA